MSLPVWLRFRSELRSGVRVWLALAVLVGLAAGALLATAAASRRTESALARHIAAYRVSDVSVSRGFWVDGRETLDLEQVERLPQVAAAGRWALLSAILRSELGKPVLPDGGAGVAVGVWTDALGGIAVDRQKLLRGRLPGPQRHDEALVDDVAFERLGYELGDTVRLRLFSHSALWGTPSAIGRLTEHPDTARTGPLAQVRIVGVVAATTPPGAPGHLMLPRAFYRRYGGQELGAFVEGMSIRLENGAADIPAFERAFRRVAGRDYPGFATPDIERGQIQEPIDRQARVLMLLAVLGVVVLLLILAQVLARQAATQSHDRTILRALGMTRRQLLVVAALRAMVLGGAASAIALLAAVLLSPLAPIGRARDLEPHPGVDVDTAVIAIGIAALMLATLAGGIGAELLATRSRSGLRPRGTVRRRRTLAELVAARGGSPSMVSGIRLALTPGRGTNALPVRSTLVAAILALAVVASAATFSLSLSHLLATPRLYGVDFDYLFWPEGGPAGRLPPGRLLSDPTIAAIASGTATTLTIDGRPSGTIAHENVKGRVAGATLVEGREPRTPTEILLGPKLIDTLGVELGDDVDVRGERTERMRVVGVGYVLQPLSGDDPFATGAALTFTGLKRVQPSAVHFEYRLRIASGADRDAVLDRLERTFGHARFSTPAKLADLSGLAVFPLPFSLMFVIAATLVLAHALVTAVRRRRTEIAILMTLGFTRGDVLTTIAWQATTIAAVGLCVGLPLGVALARFGWNVFAADLGVMPEPAIPAWQLLLAIPATLLLANLVAALPARIAARTRPSVVLQAE